MLVKIIFESNNFFQVWAIDFVVVFPKYATQYESQSATTWFKIFFFYPGPCD